MKMIRLTLALLAERFTRRSQLFANSEETVPISESLFFVNSFECQKDNWVQLSPFGDFPNKDNKGNPVIQRVRKSDAEAICNQFNSPLRLIRQPFGMPFYVGHPDHPLLRGKPGHNDTAAKGRGKNMEVRHDENCATCNAFVNSKDVSAKPCAAHGLFVRMDWNPHGTEIIANEEYHGHSVNWAAVPEKKKENGIAIFRPISVLSAGFTNNPQIPAAPATLANEVEQQEDETLTLAKERADRLDLAASTMALMLLANAEESEAAGTPDPDHADFIAWLHAQLGTDPAQGVEPLKRALTDKVEKAGLVDRVKKARAATTDAYNKHDKARAALEEKLANERKVIADGMVSTLIATGRIPMSNREATTELLVNCEDLGKEITSLCNAKPVIKIAAKTSQLCRPDSASMKEETGRQAKFQQLLNARQQQFPNETYQEAYEAVGKSTEGAQLLSNMKKAGSEE